jgi:hypothetical protein
MASLTYEMRGPRGVRHAMSDFLRLELPRRIVACRAAWGLDDDALPIPVSKPDDARADAYFEREPKAIDRWPLIAVTSGRRTQKGVDFDDDGSPVYRATYPVRVYSWVRHEGFDATQDMRDDMATAIQIALLSHVDLHSPGARLSIVPASMVVDFSDVSPVKGDRFVAGSYVGLDVNATETLTDRLALPGEQPRDTVSGVDVSGAQFPPHPALQ